MPPRRGHKGRRTTYQAVAYGHPSGSPKERYFPGPMWHTLHGAFLLAIGQVERG